MTTPPPPVPPGPVPGPQPGPPPPPVPGPTFLDQVQNKPYARGLGLPSLWPTLLVTFFFGIFGLIPAIMHTNKARDLGRSTPNYWIAFGCAVVASIVLWVVFFTILGALAVHSAPTYYYP